MKTIWIRLAAVMFLIASVVAALGDYLGKTKASVLAVVFGTAWIILMVVASLGDTLAKRIKRLEDGVNESDGAA